MMRTAAVLLVLLLVPTAAWAETIIVQPGEHPPLHINGKSNVTYRCAQAGACTMKGGTTITNSSNIVIDGFKVVGGKDGIKIENSDNITIQNSRFIEQEGAGVTVWPHGTSSNIKIINNSFENDRTGCQYTNMDNCSGYLPNGTPVAYMDYGVQVWNTNGVLIQGNTFGSLFNHAISLKYAVNDARILDNTFNGCGRTCIEVGQEGGDTGAPVSGTVIKGNDFRGKTLIAIHYGNHRNTSASGNSMNITGKPGVGDYEGGPAEEPPYVYVPPVIEDPVSRRDRVLTEGSSAADERRLRVQGEGPPVASCCDDPNNPLDPSVIQRRLKIQAMPGANFMR